MLSIIPNDSAGIAKTVLFNAKTNKVTAFDETASLEAFIKTGTVVPVPEVKPAIVDTNTQIKEKINSIQQQLDELKTLVK
jgi:hypothetical protein